MSRYASKTGVPVDRSKAEIERILTRYGATQFASGFKPGEAFIMFEVKGRAIRFHLPFPSVKEFLETETGRERTERAAEEALVQEIRRRWRALALAVKAKLECVESGIATFEEEFMAYIVLPNKQTVGAFMGPQIEAAYASGKMPALLPWEGKKIARREP